MSRRETIRDALEQGDWRLAAKHLHEAHTAQEWLRCGLNSHTDYVVTLGISRTYDHYLRLIHRTGAAEAVNTFGQARRLALITQRTEH